MTGLEKLCLGLLLLLIALAVSSYLPAVHQVQWFLRVGFPELGWTFLLPAIPATMRLAQYSNRLAAALFTVLSVLVLFPWWQAALKAVELQASWGAPFAIRVDRAPLNLGERMGHRRTTEFYKKGLEWDRYIPDHGIKARVLFVHGGSWRNGTRDEFPQMYRYLADRGYEVISPTYTLSGTAPYPAASEDVEAALEKAAGSSLPLFVAGRSSGGHLALLAAYRHPDLVRGVIGLYSPSDMVWSYQHPSNPAVLDSREAIVEFLGAAPEQKPDLYRETSPIDIAGEHSPPTLLIHGLPDCLVYHRQSERLSRRLDELGVPRYLLSLPWMEHGGDVFIHGPSGRLSAWAMESFMESLVAEPARGTADTRLPDRLSPSSR